MTHILKSLGLAVAAVVLTASLVVGCTQQPAQAQKQESGGKPMTTQSDASNGASPAAGLETATLGDGCFWCSDAIFSELNGVRSVVSGYAGGTVPNPTYHEVCTGTTGHAESIQIVFDPKVISYHDLLVVFFTTHDPTTLDRQGADVGTQYRSAIFYHSEAQKKTAEQVKAEMQPHFSSPIVTEISPFTHFYRAEDYHQDYYANNPYQGYCRMVIEPKLRKFREEFINRLKTPAR